MELTITPEVEARLQNELATGRFQDLSQLLNVAMDMFADTTPEDLADFHAGIAESLAQIDRGETYTEEEARAYLRELRTKL